MPPVPSVSPSPKGRPSPEERLRRLPASALQSYRRFAETGEEAALGELVMAALRFHLPKESAAAGNPAWPDEARLVDDLGFDSLATIETVYFFENLFQISISNAEILQVKTISDLRRFVRAKLEAGKTGAAP